MCALHYVTGTANGDMHILLERQVSKHVPRVGK